MSDHIAGVRGFMSPIHDGDSSEKEGIQKQPIYDINRSNGREIDAYFGGNYYGLPGMNPSSNCFNEMGFFGARPGFWRHGRPFDYKDDWKRPPCWEPPDIRQNPPYDIEVSARDVRDWCLICDIHRRGHEWLWCTFWRRIWRTTYARHRGYHLYVDDELP